MSCFSCSAAGPHTTINGKEVVNFASANYLGLIGHEKLLVRTPISFFPFTIIILLALSIYNKPLSQESCTTALEKYGVGSCGPRGFYGTIGKTQSEKYFK